MLPLISVIIPTYNRSRFIKRALKSILEQTYKEVEIIIIDDASEDNTEEIIKEIKSSKIKYYKNRTNMGAQAARNIGLRKAHGEYIGFLDSDDEWLPNKLELQYKVFCNSSRNLGVVYSDAYTVNELNGINGERCYKHKGNIYKQLLRSPDIDFITPLIKSECFAKIGYLDEKVPSYQEWDTFLRISKYYEFEHVPQKLAIYHIHKEDTISKDLKRDLLGYSYIVNKHRREIVSNCGYFGIGYHNFGMFYRYLRLNPRIGAILNRFFKPLLSLRKKYLDN